MADNLIDLLRDLNLHKTGWHRVEGPRGCALFPERAKDVDAWETRCLAMHAEQVPITLAEKPHTNYAEHIRELRRGD